MVYRYSDKDGTPNKLLDRTLPMVVERGKSVGWHVLHFPVRAPIMLYALYTPLIHFLYTLYTPSLPHMHLCAPVIQYTHHIYTPNTPLTHPIHTLYTPLHDTGTFIDPSASCGGEHGATRSVSGVVRHLLPAGGRGHRPVRA